MALQLSKRSHSNLLLSSCMSFRQRSSHYRAETYDDFGDIYRASRVTIPWCTLKDMLDSSTCGLTAKMQEYDMV